ncbi:unnamed protein product [Paramecium primaurelia]|uniref:Uncharacterized protein n=1 Tax=Paramecium primaurelia TaxID=5886 RepID=A0A8S1LGD1_PARPR|nr:unnamed protein product [Paramecium primaurelia]
MSNSVNGDEFSERDECDIEGDDQMPQFNMEQVYLSMTSEFDGIFAQSFLISKQITSYVIKQSLKIAEEQFMQTQIPISSNAQVMTIMELIVVSYFNQDGLTIEGCNMSEDSEPNVIHYDRWRRNRVSIEEMSQSFSEEQEEQVENEIPSQHNSSKNNKQRFSVLERKKPSTVAPPKSSHSEIRLIEFQVAEEEDDFVDKLRQKKLYDIKKKNEIEQKIKEDIIQNQKKESSSNKYTYDYDGKILLSRGVKYDKLQPTALKIKVDLKDLPKTTNQQNIPQTNSKKGSKQVIQTQQPIPIPPKTTADIPNKNIIDRKDATKDATGDKGLRIDRGAQLPYDTFSMTNGVKLIYEQRYKEGIRHQVSDSAEQLQYRLSGQNFLPGDDITKQMQQIRLTRTEYKMLTDNGNPFQQQTKSQFIPQESVETKKNLDNTKLEKTVQFNESHLVMNKFSPNKQNQQKIETKQEKILTKNAKLLENLLVQPNKPETPSQTIKKSEPIYKNPIDIFNQSLLNQKDQGKTNAKIGYFPPVPAPARSSQNRGHNGSLEQLYKLPRDRINVQQQRTQSEFYKLQPKRSTHKSMSEGMFQTFYTTHSKFDEKLRQF